MQEYRARNPEYRVSDARYSRARHHELQSSSDEYRTNAARRAAAWREANPELKAANNREWRLANPEASRRHSRTDTHIWRAKRAGSEVIERVDYGRVMRESDGNCALCGLPMEPQEMSLDHIIPLSMGGNHTYENVQVAHISCNAAKGGNELWFGWVDLGLAAPEFEDAA